MAESSASSRWPGSAPAAVSVTFDNLGEAAEQQLGASTPTGGHYSVLEALPIVLEELAEAEISATFFVEGVNAETYPAALRSIEAGGHEVAYHAWCHEEWAALSEDQERENLERGVGAMRALGLRPAGFRPPGGLIGKRTLGLLSERGLGYCSPAGQGVGIQETVLLPFAWRSVDAYHLLPAFEALRRHLDGDGEPGGPERVAETLVAAVDDAVKAGGHATLVLHTWLIEAERDAVRAVLTHVREAAEGRGAWVAPCEQVASWIKRHPDSFTDSVTLDTTSWMNPD